MNAEGRQQRRRKTGMPAVVLRIVLPPLILALARACPGPPMRHLHAEDSWVTYVASDGEVYLHARSAETWWTARKRCAEHQAALLAPPNFTALAHNRSAFHLMLQELTDTMPRHVSPALWSVHRSAENN
ncbi:Protein of unknown function, partial [Gryllus bimaculatus]